MAHFRESGALHLEVLAQAPARNVPLEIDVFDGANPGTLLESLDGATDISFERVHNEVGAGRFRLSVHDPKARPEIIDREHLAKVKVGGVYRYSFWMEKRRIVSIGEGEEAQEVWEIGGREGTLAYLERAEWYHQSYASGGSAFIQDGRWQFVADESGDLMVRGIIEALARSPSPIEFLTYDFASKTDSQGNLWPKTTTIDVEFGTSLLDFIRKLGAMGEMDFRGRHDLRLQAYVELGRHLDAASVSDAIVFRTGQNIRTTLDRTTSRPQVKTRMLVKGKGDSVFEVLRPDLEADPYIRRREGFLSFQDSADPTTIQRAAEADLAGRLADQESLTLGVTHGDGPGEWEPFADYDVGDWITVDDPGVFDMATYRIVAMTLSQREDTYDVDLTLNSVEYEALLKLARKTGAYGSGSSGGTSSAVSGGTSTGGTGGGSGRVAVETGDTPGLLYDKLQANAGITLTLEGASGSRKVGIAATAIALADLTDVDLSALDDGDILEWDATAGVFVAVPKPTGGGGGGGSSGSSLVGTATDTGGSPFALAMPAGAAVGDLIVVASNTVNSVVAAAPTGGAGGTWTTSLRFDTSSNEWQAVWWKIAEAGDLGATFSLTHSAGTDACAALAVFSDLDSLFGDGWAIDSLMAPGVLGKSDGLQIVIYMALQGGGLLTLPQHLTEAIQVMAGGGNTPRILIAYRDCGIDAAMPAWTSGNGGNGSYNLAWTGIYYLA